MAKRSGKRKSEAAFKKAERRIHEAESTGAKRLDLSRMGLAALPEAIGQLSQLRELHADMNQLTALPEAIGQLSQLQNLDLFGNQLTALPKGFGQLTQLQYLVLSGNQLTALPEWFGQLAKLQKLDLDNNQLTALPEAIGQLSQLRYLYLDNNQLTALPETIGQLSQLRYLYLNNNRLTALPEALRNLERLERLFLHGNDGLGLPPEVLGPTWQESIDKNTTPAKPAAILEYYFGLRAGKRPLNEAKLILVGHGGVGKTSLVERLVHDRFRRDEKKTEGIRITQWPVRLDGDEEVRLHVWDFGGQEIMHSTHQFFLTERSLYLVVLNGRQGHEDHDAEYWLNLVKSFAEDSPVIVVLNKMTEQPFDLNRRGLKEKFPAIHDFIETDCADRTGIDKLLKAIRRETDRLEHLRDAFPASWFAIKDHLSRMRKNFVPFDKYRKMCARHGEKGEGAQESLASALHCLGIALNYRDDPRLRDTHVLNPHWVTNGIYTILNAKQLAEQKGVIRIEQVAGILDAKKYPAGMHGFLFDLMRKFELCFSFPGDEGRYLIPELLDKDQAAKADAFKPAACLNFQYHYPVLPEGLVPRFIVRTHVLSTGLPRWRTGVIPEFEGNRALVKADVQDRKILISVAGPAKGRRRLLAIIRSHFEHIHRSFTFEVQEMVPVPDDPNVLVPYRELLVMETRGIETFQKVVGEEVRELDVQALLNGVDVQGGAPETGRGRGLPALLQLLTQGRAAARRTRDAPHAAPAPRIGRPLARPQDHGRRRVEGRDRRQPGAGRHHPVARQRGLHRVRLLLRRRDEAGPRALRRGGGARYPRHPEGCELALGALRQTPGPAQRRQTRPQVARQGHRLAERRGRHREGRGATAQARDDPPHRQAVAPRQRPRAAYPWRNHRGGPHDPPRHGGRKRGGYGDPPRKTYVSPLPQPPRPASNRANWSLMEFSSALNVPATYEPTGGATATLCSIAFVLFDRYPSYAV